MENIKLVKENHFIILNDKNRYDTRKPSYKRCIVDRIQLITRLERKIINKYVTDLLNNLPIESEVTSISLLEKILENQNIILSRLDKLESQMKHTPVIQNVSECTPKIPNIDIPSFKPSNLSPQIHISKKIEQECKPSELHQPPPFNIPIETFRGTMKDIIDSMDMLKETIDEKIDENKLEDLFNEDEMGYEPLMLTMDKSLDTSLDNSIKIPNVLLGINQIECYYEENQPYTELFHKGKNIGYVENAQFDLDVINIDKIKPQEDIYIESEEGTWIAIEGRAIPIFFIHQDPSIFNLLGEYHIDFVKYPVYCEYNIKISRFIDYENIENDYNPLLGLVPTSENLITFI